MDILNYQLSPYCPECDNRLGGVAESQRGLYCFDAACSFNKRIRDERISEEDAQLAHNQHMEQTLPQAG